MNIQINENRSLACFVLFLFIVICFSNACQFARVVRYNFAGINDHKIFPKRILRPSLTPFYFEKAIKSLNFVVKGMKIFILGAGGVVPSIIFSLNKFSTLLLDANPIFAKYFARLLSTMV